MRLSYESWDLVLHVVTPERLALLRTVRSRQPVNASDLALMIGRDPRKSWSMSACCWMPTCSAEPRTTFMSSTSG